MVHARILSPARRRTGKLIAIALLSFLSMLDVLYCRASLVQTPFAPLTQGYQTCRADPFTTFVTQAGASAGNVTLLSPAGVLAVLCILALYQMCTGRLH